MERNDTQGVDRASGNSIFWALVALALNAVTEPSRIGSFCSRVGGEPGAAAHYNTCFDPLRSSPLFCATETILDILFFFVDPRPQETPSNTDTGPIPDAEGKEQDVLPNPVDVAMTPTSEPNTDLTSPTRNTLKLMGFFLGALPQAIKLFSMSGIVGTQVSAAMFLAASVTRPFSCKSPSHFAMSVDNLKDGPYERLGENMVMFHIIAHSVFYDWLYYNIAAGLFFEDAEALADRQNSRRIVSWQLVLFARIAYLISGVFWMIVGLVRRRSLTVREWGPVFAFFMLQEQFSPEKFAASIAWLATGLRWFMNLARGMTPITLSIHGCVKVSKLCIAIGRVLSRLAAERAARSAGRSGGSQPAHPTDAGGRGLMRRFHHVIATIWQALLWMKDVFVYLRHEFDNDEKWLGKWHDEFGVTIEQLRLAWGMFNLLTALLYFMVGFDSRGTSSPSWTSMLG